MKCNLTGRNDVSHVSEHPFTISGKSWGCFSQNMNVAQCEQRAESEHAEALKAQIGSATNKQKSLSLLSVSVVVVTRTVSLAFTVLCYFKLGSDGVILCFYQSVRVLQVSRTLVPRITGSALSIIVSPLQTGRRSRWQINQLQWPAVLQTCGLSPTRGEAQTDAADLSYLPAIPQPCKGEACGNA